MKWTKNDVEKLKELYPNNKNEYISEQIKFSIKSIESKANRLGLKKNKDYKSNLVISRNKRVGTDITIELIKKTALKYKTRGEFQRLDGSIYTTARKKGLLNDVCTHMVKGNYSIPQLILFFFIKEIFKNDEILYNSNSIINPYELDIYLPKYRLSFEYDGKFWHKDNRKDKRKNLLCKKEKIKLIRIKENSRNYTIDIKDQLIQNINIINLFKKTSIEFIKNIQERDINSFVNDNINDLNQIKLIISKYKYYSDFRKNENSTYLKIYRRGILNDLTKELKKNKIKWSIDLAITEVGKYNNLNDFIKNSKPAYIYIQKNNLQYLLKNLHRKYKSYNIDDIQKYISNYEYLIDFRKDHKLIYNYLKKNKMLSLLKNLKKYKNRNCI